MIYFEDIIELISDICIQNVYFSFKNIYIKKYLI